MISKELDSLADCVAFGGAPGYLAHRTYLSGMGVVQRGIPVDLGVLVAAIFPVCAAYLLARFNVMSSPASFSGLPSPIGAMLVVLGVISFRHIGIPKVLFAVLFRVAAFPMTSAITYSMPQSCMFRQLRGLKLVGFVVLTALLLALFRSWIILLFITVYVLLGLIGFYHSLS
jgi:CDP-diacylglycerol--serine O-phosphatidyltransferase